MAWIFRNEDYEGNYEVGYYEPKGRFVGIYGDLTLEQAEEKVHYLNGGEVNNLDLMMDYEEEQPKTLRGFNR